MLQVERIFSMEMISPSQKPLFNQSNVDLVVMGASAGGVEALQTILATLPRDFPTAIAIAQHRPPDRPSFLCEVLQRKTALSVKEAVAGDSLKAGTVYLAPAGQQLLVDSAGSLSLLSKMTGSDSQNRFCPSVDVLFTAAAESFNARSLGVVLTGMLYDGAKGAQAIAMAGGRVLVQDETTSPYFSMPYSAIKTGRVNFVLPIDKIAAALITLTMVRGANSLFSGAMPYFASRQQ